jgi:hypothetical protein
MDSSQLPIDIQCAKLLGNFANSLNLKKIKIVFFKIGC